jgi:hypothetical protein
LGEFQKREKYYLYKRPRLEAGRKKRREEVFPADLKKAFAMGAALFS